MRVPQEILDQIAEYTEVPYPSTHIYFLPWTSKLRLKLAITLGSRVFKLGTEYILWGHLAHELFHVYQYSQHGFLRFILKYLPQLRLRWKNRPLEVGAINSAFIIYAQPWGTQVALYKGMVGNGDQEPSS